MRDSGVSDAGKAAGAVAPGPMPAIKRACPCAKLAGDRRDQTAGRRICGSGEAGRRRAGSRSRRQRNPHAHASPGAGRARPVARDGLHLPQIAALAAVGGPGRPFPEARQAADTVIGARLLSSFGRPNRQTRLEGAFPGQRAPLHCRAPPLQWHRRLDRPSALRFLGHAARSHRAPFLSARSRLGVYPLPFLNPCSLFDSRRRRRGENDVPRPDAIYAAAARSGGQKRRLLAAAPEDFRHLTKIPELPFGRSEHGGTLLVGMGRECIAVCRCGSCCSLSFLA
jgi:hypothetical protein